MLATGVLSIVSKHGRERGILVETGRARDGRRNREMFASYSHIPEGNRAITVDSYSKYVSYLLSIANSSADEPYLRRETADSQLLQDVYRRIVLQ